MAESPNKVLKGKSPTHVDVKNRLRRVEERSIQTMSIEDVRGIIEKKRGVLEG